MPLFELQRQSDLATFRVDAPNAERAVAHFSEQLGVELSLIDNDIVSRYMMREIVPNTVTFVKFDIPVYSEV